MNFRILLVIATSMVAGCVSTIEVNKLPAKDDETVAGVRFSLPQRFVLVEPKPDGKIDVKYLFLPDDNQTFAVSSHSILTKNSLKVTVASGLLTGIGYKPNSSDVPSALATSAGNVRADEVGVELAAATTLESTKKALAKSIHDQELIVKQAEKKVELAEKAFGGDESKILPYRIELEVALSKLADLKQQEQTLSAANDPSSVTFNDAETKTRHAYGPMLYRIDERIGGDGNLKIALVPVEDRQRHFRVLSSGVSSPAVQTPVGPPCTKFEDAFEALIVSTGNAPTLIGLRIKSGIKFNKATATLFDRPAMGTLTVTSDGAVTLTTVDGQARPVPPSIGLPARAGTQFSVEISVVTESGACPAKGNPSVP